MIEFSLPVPNRARPLFGHVVQRSLPQLHNRLVARERSERQVGKANENPVKQVRLLREDNGRTCSL
jgi:hypothetical protein